MATEITMPALSASMTEGNLARWLKQEGDVVKAGEVLLEIETDKALVEYEAPAGGTLARVMLPEGSQDVKVGTTLVWLLQAGEAVPDGASGAQTAAVHRRSPGGCCPGAGRCGTAGRGHRRTRVRSHRQQPARAPSGPAARLVAGRHPRQRSAGPHRAGRHRIGLAGGRGQARPGGGAFPCAGARCGRSGPGHGRRAALRGHPAHQHATRHRPAPDRIQAAGAALLPDDRLPDRRPAGAARAGQCRPARAESVGQRPGRPGRGRCAEAGARCQCVVDGPCDPALAGHRHQRGRGHAGRADHAGAAPGRYQIAGRARRPRSRSWPRARARGDSSPRSSRAAASPSPISACSACASSPRS